MNSVLYLILGFCAVLSALGNATTSSNGIEFVILHNNDMLARFEQTDVDGGKCRAEDVKANKCYGGFARVAHEVRHLRKDADNRALPVIYLNAGNTFAGTTWFTVFKENITAAFLNKLQPDAISLGNHEFDNNVEGLVPFLEKVNFPVLACNLDLSEAPTMKNAKSFANSTILEVNGVKIGVIGYLTPETKSLVSSNKVKFKPEIESINWVAEELKAAGINIIIALGHSGYHTDQEIAKNCPEVDIVIGGHSHSFLFDGEQPSTEKIEGKYPTVVKQANGKEVPVVQAYAYTKYLGELHVKFDGTGNLIGFHGSPILLNGSVPEDDDILKLLDYYRPSIADLEESIVGHSKVNLEGSHLCRIGECNLGNLIADAYIYARVLEDRGGVYWTDAPIAFIQAGAIRNSIGMNMDGAITKQDILSILPFNNKVVVATVTGKTIRRAMQRSAELYGTDDDGGFLQMSGVRVIYDVSRTQKNKVTALRVRCAKCKVPTYQTLSDNSVYKILISEFLYNGGYGYKFTEDNGRIEYLKLKEWDIVINYLRHRDYVYPEHESRIEFYTNMNRFGIGIDIPIASTSDNNSRGGKFAKSSINFNKAMTLRSSLLIAILNLLKPDQLFQFIFCGNERN